jgi:hypothetical protein
MKKLFLVIIGLVTGLVISVVFSAQSLAHSGHNHNDPSAFLLHLIWITPFILGVFILTKYVKKRMNATQNRQQGSEL